MRRTWTLPPLLALLVVLAPGAAASAATRAAVTDGIVVATAGVGDGPVPGGVPDVGPGRETPPVAPAPTIRVPRNAGTIQEAVDRARPGGLVLVSPGLYREAVVVKTPFLTIRGTDRDGVVLDGGFERDDGIHVVQADGVAIENMTARHYLSNGFVWSDVFGYRGSYLTAYDDGGHGLVAERSRYGQFDHSYAGGHPASGFAVAACDPCRAVVTDVLGEHNALGFAATNADDISIVNSEWAHNMAGIVPNTPGTDGLAPQRGVLIAGNVVDDNDERGAPAHPLEYSAFGIGIAVAGAAGDVVADNIVVGQERFGIALLPLLDRGFRPTSGNVVRDNRVASSGIADLVLSAPSAGSDCFEGNQFSTSRPAAIEWRFGCGSPLGRLGGGDAGTTLATVSLYLDAFDGRFSHGDWRSVAAPRAQPQMLGAAIAPPDPAVADVAVPEPFRVRTQAFRRTVLERNEVSVFGFALAAGWWAVLLGLYAYALPTVLYCAWVSIAIWDLARQDAVPNRRRIAWMLVVLAIPLAGPVAYFAFGRSPIQPALRITLIAGGLVVYAALAALALIAGA